MPFPACLCVMNGYEPAAAAVGRNAFPPCRPHQLYKNPVWEINQSLTSPPCSASIFECRLHEYQAAIVTVVRVCFLAWLGGLRVGGSV